MSVEQRKPLFIPLRAKFYELFAKGKKTIEFRKYGPRWNEDTCPSGRRVVLSRGYGKADRQTGVIVGFQKRYVDSDDWLACYGEPGEAACITIRVDGVCAV